MSWRRKRTENLIGLAVSVAVAFVTTAIASSRITIPTENKRTLFLKELRR